MKIIDRKQVLVKNISISVVFKAIAIFLTFYMTSQYYSYLGAESYGVWVVLLAVSSWINAIDFGIGNALRIKLTECLSKENLNLGKSYIISSYILLTLISLFFYIAIVFFIANYDIGTLLGFEGVEEKVIKTMCLILFTSISVSMILGLYRQLYFAIHKSYFIEVYSSIQHITICLLFILFKDYDFDSLILVSVINALVPVFIGIASTIYFFWKNTDIRINIKSNIDVKFKEISGFSSGLFIIQISSLIIYSTDSIIISKYLGSEAVSSYDIVSKMYNAIILGWYILQTPLMALYSNAFFKGDYLWIRKVFKRLNYVFVVIILFILSFTYVSPTLANLWIGEVLNAPLELYVGFAIFVLIRIYGDLYICFLNAVGDTKLQTLMCTIFSLVNIPLSIYFLETLNMGSFGVILATSLCLLPFAIIMPIKSYSKLSSAMMNSINCGGESNV